VLGARWAYDGLRDPVLVTQLLALIQGAVRPQAQSINDTVDESVVGHCASPVPLVVDGPAIGSDVTLSGGAAVLTVVRVLQPADPAPGAIGHVTAGWRLPDDTEVRGYFAVVTEA
jgi:hypothetical protein